MTFFGFPQVSTRRTARAPSRGTAFPPARGGRHGSAARAANGRGAEGGAAILGVRGLRGARLGRYGVGCRERSLRGCRAWWDDVWLRCSWRRLTRRLCPTTPSECGLSGEGLKLNVQWELGLCGSVCPWQSQPGLQYSGRQIYLIAF